MKKILFLLLLTGPALADTPIAVYNSNSGSYINLNFAGSGTTIGSSPSSTITNDCVMFSNTTGALGDAGAPCGAGGGGGGSVVSVSAGNLSPLFTTSVANPTTTPAITHTLSNAAANTAFANCTNGSAAPSFATFTACLDSAFGSTQGGVIYRGGSGWAFLGAGGAGQYLESLGAGANLQWNTPAGGGGGSSASIVTVTSNATMASGTTNERCNSSSPLTVTLPTSGMVAGQLPFSSIKNVGTGACTVDAGAGNTIDGIQTFALTTQYRSVSLLCTAVVSGVCTSWDVQ